MRSFRRWIYSFSLILLLPSFHVSAAPVQYEAVSVGQGRYTTTGVGQPITMKISTAGVSKFQQIVPVAKSSTFGLITRSLRFRDVVVSAGVVAALEGLGYVLESVNGDFKKEDFVVPESLPAIDTSAGYRCYTHPGLGIPCYPDPTSACHASALALGFGNVFESTNGLRCNLARPSGVPNSVLLHAQGSSTCSPNTVLQGGYCVSNAQPEKVIIDLDPSDWEVIGQQLETNLSPRQKSQLLTGALATTSISGSVDPANYPVAVSSTNTNTQWLYDAWPQLQQDVQRLVNAELALQVPNHQLTPEEVDTNDQAVIAPAPAVPDSGGGGSFDLPEFCTWASWFCEPFEGGDQPPIPTLEFSVDDYSSGLPTTGTCPAPHVLSLAKFGTHELSYQPFCDLASLIRVPLIAISYFMSAFIVVGVRR